LPERVGEPWVVADAETVRWNGAADAFIDITEFERMTARPETHAEAIELYAGDLLEDIYDDWVVAERERLRTRYLSVLTESLERYRTGRAFAEAIACAKRLLATDPWREDTVRSLLAVRYESGDTAGALAEYELFAKRLRDELAIAPMPETIAVRQSILRNEAVPGSLDGPPRSPAAESRRAIEILPFVGRERELAALQAAWTRAARGAGSLFLLSGEAGVGKTRLTAELARVAQAEGGRVFVGTTASPESTPYQALVEALRSGLPLLLTKPPSAARRAALVPLLPELRDPDAPDVALPERAAERETARMYDALASAVRGLASPRPLLLILEDLHWAGSASIDALRAIVRELGRAPILLLATCRDEETPADHPLRALQRSLRGFVNVEEIPLGRLGEADVAQLISRVDGLRERGPALAHEFYAHSEGNALFLNEAISVAIERAPLEGARATSMASLISARIARLGDEARAVAEIAAVAGSGCSVELIREVSNLPAVAVALGLDELLDRRILREASRRANYDYVFTHHLIASAIYERTDPHLRAQRHSRIARLLDRAYRESQTSSAREVARHYEGARDAARAAQWYVTAARQAAAVHAYGDAIVLASRALENAPSDESRVESLRVRERARARDGDREGQRADIDELERLSGNDPAARFDVLERRVLLARTLGESEEEGRRIAEMELVAGSLGDDARAQAHLQRGTHAGLRSRPAEGLEPVRFALATYERVGDVRGQLECLYLLVDFTLNVGDVEASREYLALMRDRAASLGDPVVEARALSVAANAALQLQEYRECFDLTTRALALHVATNDREGEAFSHLRLASTSAWLTDFDTALREFDLSLEAHESIGHKRGIALTHTNRTMLLMRLGLFEEALVSIERSNVLFETVHEQRTIVANRVNASFVKLHLGDALAAKELAQSALTAAKEIAFPIFEAAALANVGNAERSLGEYDAAIEHMEAGIALRRPIQNPRDFVDDLADLTLAYVEAGRGRDGLATAEELGTIGATSFEGAFWPHYIWWAMAQGLAAGGAAARASVAAAQARAEVVRFAERIEDSRLREAFLSVPVNARIAGRC
jgi:DNA-binding SARP family transcriptional activator